MIIAIQLAIGIALVALVVAVVVLVILVWLDGMGVSFG